MRVDNNNFFGLVANQLAGGQSVRITVVGNSMWPTLHEGDQVVLQPVAGDPKVGQVVLFCAGGQWRLHRVVDCQADRYTMQGDNALTAEQCLRSQIVATLESSSRRGNATGRRMRCVSRVAVLRRGVRSWVWRWLGTEGGRRRLRPWYFALLAVLMWAPLNGVGIPLNNYLLGLRADHLIHASVYLPCALMLYGAVRPTWVVWAVGVAVGITTECVQYLLPYRGFDINDMVANFIGVTLGFALLMLCVRKKHKHRPSTIKKALRS